MEIIVIIRKKDSFKFIDHFVLFISTTGSQQHYSLSYSLPVFTFDMVWSGPVYPTKQVGYRKLSQKASRNLQTPCTSLYFLCNHWTIPCRAGVGETKGPKRYHQGLGNICILLFVFNKNFLFSLVNLIIRNNIFNRFCYSRISWYGRP